MAFRGLEFRWGRCASKAPFSVVTVTIAHPCLYYYFLKNVSGFLHIHIYLLLWLNILRLNMINKIKLYKKINNTFLIMIYILILVK